MSINSAKVRHIGRNLAKKALSTPSSNQRKRQAVTFHLHPSEDCLILSASNLKEARQLLQLEAERLLEEGWEVMQISKRSYIAVLVDCEIYLHTSRKGLSARIYQFDEHADRL